ncbi:hypothetical protein EMIHUDRAFT_458728 [Emiliania huxleyi CCMP1516]|uniref:PUA domain-containing protein n=2 Tax=Emiliania huxleyi TaxID=2903 RepID=A0A0D3J775_EMIH1|nr:hypothetical protein EMIHUDRAFT_458728 [Emiliania huxleyi CCMP1516]EOD19360.1 hypothetical protein EMIHUDRAFT_458728 [Emiliania huxleyi CCMP1516]|eukprot:XP_005771789.1 hypothetical protein EMIHUDRAFT_458728 [Emiliania huxleyi CCMP1516]
MTNEDQERYGCVGRDGGLDCATVRPCTLPMPFKQKEILVKAEQKLSGKDVKKLSAEARLAAPEDAALLLRKGADVVQRRTAGGLVCRIIDCDRVPVLFELGSSGLLPTLPGLWRVPTALPALVCPPEAARYLINGADLLLPGVRAADASVAALPAGAAACVRIFGNPSAVAVGVLAVPGAAVAEAVRSPGAVKGTALQVEHVVGDALWRLAGRPLPNSGFVVAEGGGVKDASLPMTVNAFYSQHMRPGRPAGTSLDVKVSSRQKGKKSGEGGIKRAAVGRPRATRS